MKMEGELWDDLVSSSSQNSHLVSKATRLWESILARKSKCRCLVVLFAFRKRSNCLSAIDFSCGHII